MDKIETHALAWPALTELKSNGCILSLSILSLESRDELARLLGRSKLKALLMEEVVEMSFTITIWKQAVNTILM